MEKKEWLARKYHIANYAERVEKKSIRKIEFYSTTQQVLFLPIAKRLLDSAQFSRSEDCSRMIFTHYTKSRYTYSENSYKDRVKYLKGYDINPSALGELTKVQPAEYCKQLLKIRCEIS